MARGAGRRPPDGGVGPVRVAGRRRRRLIVAGRPCSAHGLGLDVPPAGGLVLPSPGRRVHRARLEDGSLTVRGLAICPLRPTPDVDRGGGVGRRRRSSSRCPAADLALRPVGGVAPRPRPGRDGRHRRAVHRAARPVGRPLGAGGGAGPAGRRPRTDRDARRGCWSWPASTPSSGSSSTGRSARSRPCGTGWPTRWWPSRPATPRCESAWDEGSPEIGGHGQGAGRAGGAHGGPPLPAGAGRHRIHHGARLPPLRPPCPGARRAVRFGPLPHPGPRCASCWPPGSSRRCHPSELSGRRRPATGDRWRQLRRRRPADAVRARHAARSPLRRTPPASSAVGGSAWTRR